MGKNAYFVATGMLSSISEVWTADGTTLATPASVVPYKAGWNYYYLIEGDANGGVHNPKFDASIFRQLWLY